jgi:hypothetical protein
LSVDRTGCTMIPRQQPGCPPSAPDGLRVSTAADCPCDPRLQRVDVRRINSSTGYSILKRRAPACHSRHHRCPSTCRHVRRRRIEEDTSICASSGKAMRSR